MDQLQLIDFLSEDDFLVASPLCNNLQDFRISVVLENIDEHEDFKLNGNVSSRQAENTAEIIEQSDRKLLLSKTMESGRASSLRKSLAWDSAFFTSAGVLDPEELFTINKGFEKAEAPLLRAIPKDIRKRRSTDLEYTLDSDKFSFEINQSMELDLFEDIRASIHRSVTVPRVLKSGCKSRVGGEACKQKTQSLKNLDVISQNRHAAKGGESNSYFLKPPKILGRMNPVSVGQTKKVCLGVDHVKMESRTATSGSRQGLIVSKKSGFGNSCHSTSSTASPISSSSVSLIASNDSTDSCSPFGSALSFKSASNSRKNSRKPRLVATDSTSKTPLRCSLGGKSWLGKPCLSPTSNHSSYASPDSSFDGWSSGSSSACANHRSNLLEPSFDANTSRGACLGKVATQALDLQSCSQYQLFDHQEIQQTMLLNQCTEEVAGTGNASAEAIRNVRPSGLRMPSPKIGFFDEDKSPVLSVSAGSQLHFGAQSSLSNPNAATNRKRPSKTPPARVLAENGNPRSDAKQYGVPYGALSPVPRYEARKQELDKSSPKVSTGLATGSNFPKKASKCQRNISPMPCRENCSKSRKVDDGGHDTRKLGQHTSLKPERKRTEQMVRTERSRESKRHVRLRSNKDVPIVQREDKNPSKKENGRSRGDHLEKDPHSLHEKEKENLPSFDYHLNDLSRYFETIDLSRDTVMELNGKKGSPHACFSHNFTGSKADSLSISAAVEFVPSTRTPLADRNSVLDRAKSFGLTTETILEPQ
ncbi:hypothetical protein Acr_04g0001270 [Actinidia rufa]|uniref:Uncharacterized protein n=1 Tax=Actinidia rufa TaxID=165716 RepID=A0A7J0EHK7_9ERIC|nr:hypothetical protein Acr_04g0001270 [Actinidia rufa]